MVRQQLNWLVCGEPLKSVHNCGLIRHEERLGEVLMHVCVCVPLLKPSGILRIDATVVVKR